MARFPLSPRRIPRPRALPALRVCALALGALAVATQPASAFGLIRDAEIESTLRRLSDPIFRAANLAPDSVTILIANDSAPNAFVFQGRNMVLTTGLLREFPEPAQLQGVIAHEAGHISGGHLARRQIASDNLQGAAIASTVLGLLAAAAAGAAGGGNAAQAGAGIAMGSQSMLQRVMLAHSRGEESSADQAALTYLDRAGVDPAGMRSVLEHFRGQEVFSDRHRDPYALTHPISTARLAAIDRRVRESRHRDAQPDDGLVYWTTRMEAKLDGFLDTPSATLSRLDPQDDGEFATLRRAIALHRAPDPDAALREADRLIALRPDDAYYHELKGQILLESGRGADAVAPYRRAVDLAPGEPLILGYLGRALLSLGTPEANREALEALKQGARESHGGDPSLLRDLAFAYARTGQEGMAALVTADRLIMTGQEADARRLAQRARDLLPSGSPAWLRADDILASTRPRE
ncbi:MAG: M48 family metalloprotease [Pseudomonadota bacterium]